MEFMHSEWIITLPRESLRQAATAPHLRSQASKRESKDTSHGVGLGAGEMEGPGELGGAAQVGFLEEENMGVSKQFTTFFKINIALICFFTS